jgi:hypothetical protein
LLAWVEESGLVQGVIIGASQLRGLVIYESRLELWAATGIDVDRFWSAVEASVARLA